MHTPRLTITETQCLRCGLCAADCPLHLIRLTPFPTMINPERCIGCQHCFAICPTAALEIYGKKPAESQLLKNGTLTAAQLELLLKGRRSIRQYKADDVAKDLIARLVEIVSYAPTAENRRQILLTCIDSREKKENFLAMVMTKFEQLVNQRGLPERLKFMERFIPPYRDDGVDVFFRNAPHIIVASAPKTAQAAVTDCAIGLSYLELFAPVLGIGTVWNELARVLMAELLPELKQELGIPEEHLLGGVMAFGYPAVKYQRTVQRDHTRINYY